MISTIAIAGAGTMGYGLAIDFARQGVNIHLIDVNQAALDKGINNLAISLDVFIQEGLINEQEKAATIARVSTFTDKAQALAKANMLIEALPEVLEIKREYFREADTLCGPETIFVTNSSSLRPSDMFSAISPARKKRSLMVHYFNPPEIVPLVELLSLPETDESLMVEMRAFYERIGKVPVRINKEVAGLSANRLQMALWREMIWQIDNGIASVKDLNKVLTYGPAFRWSTTGVISMMDMTGIDIIHHISNNLLPELDDSKSAQPLLEKMMREKKMGLKGGQGFFRYAEGAAKTKDAYVRRLVRQKKLSQTNIEDIDALQE